MNAKASIQKEDYVRQRISPKPSEADYIHFSDWQLVMKDFQTDAQLRILDYSGGGSP